MYLAKVTANIVSTQKTETLRGKTLLMVQPIDAEGNPFGDELTAVDGVGAGIGDIVLALCEGASSRMIANISPKAPVEVVIAGIIDFADSDYGRLTSDGELLRE